MSESPPELLTVKGVCQWFNVSSNWVRHRSRKNAADPLPCHRLGRALRYDRNEIQQYLDAHKSSPRGNLATGEGTARDWRIHMLSRRRRQKGSVRLRGRKTKFWEGIYWVDILDADGQIAGRRQRFVNLGYPSELPTKKAALRKLDDILREINAPDYEPESEVTLGEFINKIYIPTELRTKSPSTARDVKNALKKNVIPKFGHRQMTHIPKLIVKQYFLSETVFSRSAG
jgi:hypothetical protein